MNENRPEYIDEIFKDSLQSFQGRPARQVWEKIEEQLDSDKRRLYVSRFRALLLISAGLLVLSLSLGIRVFHSYKYIPIHPDKTYRSSNARPIISGTSQKAGIPFNTRESIDSSYTSIKEKHTDALTILSREKIEEPLYPEYTWSVHSQPLNFKNSTGMLDNNQLLADRINSFKKMTHSDRISSLNHWSVTGYFSQELTGYNLSDHDSTAASGREIEKKERSVFSASGGILVNYRLTGKWIIQSGLIYSWSNSIMDPSTSFAVKDNNGDIKFRVNTVSGYGYLPPPSSVSPNVGDSALTDNSYGRLHYLTIPLIVSYRFMIKRFTILAGAGVSFNFLTSATLESGIQGTSNNQQKSTVLMNGLTKINYGVLLKSEIQYSIHQGWSLTLMTSFKNALTPINLHTSPSTYPYNFGIGLGISRAF